MVTFLRRFVFNTLYCSAFVSFATALAILLPAGSGLFAVCRSCEAYAAGPVRSQAPAIPSSGRVAWVIDGDTVVLDSGVKVRYLGIDTPELGMPFYEKASGRH